MPLASMTFLSAILRPSGDVSYSPEEIPEPVTYDKILS